MKHSEQAKLARDAYEFLTGARPPYPRSAKDLVNLQSDVMFKRLQREVEKIEINLKTERITKELEKLEIILNF